MTTSTSLKWIAGVLLAPIVLAALFIAIFGWNWLRGPIERMATERTGRVLAIKGDLTVKFGWPLPEARSAS
jgi:AsmA protein